MNGGPFDPPKLRVPVKLVNGKWQFFYGGPLPIAEGTIGDLVVERHAVTDSKFLSTLRRRSVHRILDESTELLVALTIHEGVDAHLGQHLKKLQPGDLSAEYYRIARPGATRFVKVRIGPPVFAHAQRLDKEKGGVWLQFEGTQPKGISVSSVELPPEVRPEPVDSLNHAFTCLSTVYEPWRKSHTGNIYARMLYRERNDKWYPLETLRCAAEAKEEQALLGERWAEITKALPLGSRAGRE